MHRLSGTEDGYALREKMTRDFMTCKKSMIEFIKLMTIHEYEIPPDELKLLAHADAASDELLNIYHTLVLQIDDE